MQECVQERVCMNTSVCTCTCERACGLETVGCPCVSGCGGLWVCESMHLLVRMCDTANVCDVRMNR